MMIAYEDHILFLIFDKLKCKMGKHKEFVKSGKLKIHKYYCQICGKGRKHPALKVVDGTNKKRDNKFKF